MFLTCHLFVGTRHQEFIMSYGGVSYSLRVVGVKVAAYNTFIPNCGDSQHVASLWPNGKALPSCFH